jgi:hypothetical protein
VDNPPNGVGVVLLVLPVQFLPVITAKNEVTCRKTASNDNERRVLSNQLPGDQSINWKKNRLKIHRSLLKKRLLRPNMLTSTLSRHI